MLELAKEKMKEIMEVEQKLNETEEKLDILENQRLGEIVNVCIKGLKFEKIYSSKISINPNGRYFSDDKIIYFKENDKFIKGAKLIEENIFQNHYNTGEDNKTKELYLMNDGSFKVFYLYSDISYFQGETCKYERVQSKKFNLKEFNVDEIIEEIVERLEERLCELGERNKAQKERLQKIEKLIIK